MHEYYFPKQLRIVIWESKNNETRQEQQIRELNSQG